MTEQEKAALVGLLNFLVEASSSQHNTIYKIALAALTAEPVAWVVMAPQGDYIERNPDIVAHLEGCELAKCKPLYAAPTP